MGRNGVGKTTFLKFLAAARFDGVPPNLQILHIEQEVRTGPMRTGPASRHLPCSPTILPSYHPTILPAACTLRISHHLSIPPSHHPTSSSPCVDPSAAQVAGSAESVLEMVLAAEIDIGLQPPSHTVAASIT